MNYLAHFFLAGDYPELIIGNYIADSIKGKNYTNYPEGIAKGILMHRALDELIDTHYLPMQTKELLKPQLKRYSGIALDFLYDHLLAKNWNSFSSVPLQKFSDNVIQLVSEYPKLPTEQAQFLKYMKSYNLPAAYADEKIITQALYHFSKRIQSPYELSNAITIYQNNSSEIDAQFISFFTHAMTFSREYIKTMK